MNALVVYDSVYGNTKEIAEALVRVFKEFGDVQAKAANVVTTSDFTGIDLLAIGGPTQAHGLSPNMKDLLDRAPVEKLTGLPTVTFDTRLHWFAWLSGSAAVSLAKRLQEHGVNLLVPPESFTVEGSKGPLQIGEIDRAAAWAHTVLEHIEATAPAAR